MPPPEEKNANGKLKLLESIASGGDNWIKFGTLLLVAITGGGNFLATTKTGEFNAAEITRGLNEIHDLHDQLSASMERQRRMSNQLDDLTRELYRPYAPYARPSPTPNQ